MVAKKYHYKPSTIYTLLRDVKAGKKDLFPVIQKGAQQRRTPSDAQEKIIAYRRQNLSAPAIQSHLREEGINVSVSTVERILKNAGFGKLKRRTNKGLGKSIIGFQPKKQFPIIPAIRLENRGARLARAIPR